MESKTVPVPIARLTVMDDGPNAPHGARLMVGAINPGTNHFFQGNMVYEVVECMGVLTLREVGECGIARHGERREKAPLCDGWGTDLGLILTGAGNNGRLWMTRKELAKLDGI